MAVKDLEIINVLNYNENVVSVKTKDGGYLMESAEGGVPSVLPLTPSEIEYINGSSVAFKQGILRFEEDMEEEVYTKLLKINDWKNILSCKDIETILTKPTIEGLQKVINIKTSSEFERVRGIFTQMKNKDDKHLSIRVEKIINQRYKELFNHQVKTDIILQPKDVADETIVSEEVNTLKEQNNSLQEQMARMQEMLEQMMTVNNTENKEEIANKSTEEIKETNETEESKEKTKEDKPVKKPGRPANKNK